MSRYPLAVWASAALWSAPCSSPSAPLLSLFEFSGPWALGGGITVCSMLPLRPDLPPPRHEVGHVLRSCLWRAADVPRHEERYVPPQNFWQVLAIILLDYVVAFGVIGLAGIFDKCIKNRPVSIAVGSVFATLLRTGLPLRVRLDHLGGPVAERAGLGFPAVVHRLQRQLHDPRNEVRLTTVAAVALYFPLKKYYYGEDLK